MNEIRVKMLKAPFNYHWPRSSRVSVVRETGPMMLDKTIAEAAIERGYAEPFDPAPANPRKPAARRSSTRRRSAKTGNAADKGQGDRVDREDLARDDRADDQPPVADAG